MRREIDTKCLVDRLQRFIEREHRTELARDVAADIGKNRKRQFVLFLRRQGLIGRLRRDCNQRWPSELSRE
jgi:hypothetical protein